MFRTNNEPTLPDQERYLYGGTIITCGLIALAISCKVSEKSSIFGTVMSQICSFSMISAVITGLITLIYFLISNQLTKGKEYGLTYYKITHSLRKELMNAGFYEISPFGRTILPKISVIFNNNRTEGIIKIQNSLHYDKRLDELNISSALGDYVLERSYPDADQNAYVFEIYDHRCLHPICFTSASQFKEYSDKYSPYQLFTDNRSVFDIQGILIVGQTGSGKTYGLYCLLLEMKYKSINYHLYFADPKGSSLYVLGEQIGLQYNSVDIDEITEEMSIFVKNLHERSKELAEKLAEKLDSDYRDYNLEPHVLVIDEFNAYMSAIATYPKAERDKINNYLRDIILMGRQLGFFLIIVMQKSDATTIPTALRDNLTVKIVLGEAEETTYTTTFGTGVEIPNRKFGVGEGVYIAPGSAHKVKLISFPKLDFNILQAFTSQKK